MSGRMTRHRTPTLEVREALLRAARELLAEGGPAALGVRDIAGRAGVAPMGVYKRFGSKNGIIDELFRHRNAFDRLVDAVRLGLAAHDITPGDPVEIAQRFWAACHGSISLQLRGIGFVSDYDSHYAELVRTLLRGVAVTED
jgi:AcrR family transcriptional regulator